MPTTITPAAADPNGQTYTTPADTDAINAGSVNGAFQKIANHIAWLRANPVTRSQFPAVGQQVSASSGPYACNSNTYQAITNLSVTLTTTGRPVMVMLVPDGTSDGSTNVSKIQAGGAVWSLLSLVRGATRFYVAQYAPPVCVPPSIMAFDAPAAGTYTYAAQAVVAPGDVLYVAYAKLIAYEL